MELHTNVFRRLAFSAGWPSNFCSAVAADLPGRVRMPTSAARSASRRRRRLGRGLDQPAGVAWRPPTDTGARRAQLGGAMIRLGEPPRFALNPDAKIARCNRRKAGFDVRVGAWSWAIGRWTPHLVHAASLALSDRRE
jgi:hypothetical protein